MTQLGKSKHQSKVINIIQCKITRLCEMSNFSRKRPEIS